MALYLTEKDVEALLTVPEAIQALETAFLRQGEGRILNQSRRRLYVPAGTFHTMCAADLDAQTFGMKAYTSFAPQTRFLVLLYSAENGDLLALLEADRLGQIRTGAATGVATRFLARADGPLQVGIYGAGWQSQSQLEAVCAVRDVAAITVYSRNPEQRTAFCARMERQLGLPVRPAERPEEAARDRQIVITATTAKDPVLFGEWLSPGAHVNAIGANQLNRREIDEMTVRRAGAIVVDSRAQSQEEAGDLLGPYERRLFCWEQVRELGEVVAGKAPGRRSPEEITLFKSNGVALEDIAVASLVLQKARALQRGVEIPLWAGTD